MKPNDSQTWTINLYGDARSGCHHAMPFTGTIDEVLGRADEEESEVDFEVHQFVITRATQVSEAVSYNGCTQCAKCRRLLAINEGVVAACACGASAHQLGRDGLGRTVIMPALPGVVAISAAEYARLREAAAYASFARPILEGLGDKNPLSEI